MKSSAHTFKLLAHLQPLAKLAQSLCFLACSNARKFGVRYLKNAFISVSLAVLVSACATTTSNINNTSQTAQSVSNQNSIDTQFFEQIDIQTPHAYTSTDNDYLTAIRLQREIERESGSRDIRLYSTDDYAAIKKLNQKKILGQAWLAEYPGIVDSNGNGICETYYGSDRSLREVEPNTRAGSDRGLVVKRFQSSKYAAEFIAGQIIREYDQEKVGDIDTCQFKNPGAVTQFLAYFDLKWFSGNELARRTSLEMRNRIEWIPNKILSTYEKRKEDNMAMCGIEDKKRHAHMYMLSRYMWRAHVPMRVDYSWSQSVDSLIQQLKHKKVDKWSHSVKERDYARQEMRLSPDNGLWLSALQEGDVTQTVVLVEPGSAAEQAGLSRGDKVLAINGEVTAKLNNRALRKSIHEEMAREGRGDYRVVKRGMNHPQNLSIDYQDQVRNTIHKSEVLSVNGAKVGYINIKEFQAFSRQELDAVFEQFKREGVQELILDLRYNIGGNTFSSAHLAGLIVGKDDVVYSRSRLADAAWNAPVQYMDADENALGLKRVIALTSEMTSSAAEQMLNAMNPYLDLVTIGSKTYGKPITMAGYELCDDLVFAATAVSLNSKNKHVPFTGMAATCPVDDAIDVSPDDSNNPLMKTALNYINTGSCQ